VIWVSFAVMIGAIVASLALLRSDRGDALGIPLIAIGTFAFLYLIQPMQLILSGDSGLFLTDWQFAKGVLVPAIMLAFFMWGWLRPGRRRLRPLALWDLGAMWNTGFATASVGLILHLIFLERSGGILHSFSEQHGHAMAWETNTAYLYDGPWLMLSGSVMMMLGDRRTRSKRWKSLTPYIFLSIYLLEAILTASRGPLFAVATVFFVGTSIAQCRKVSFGQAARVLLPVGVAVILLVGYRSFLHLGPQSIEETSASIPSPERAFEDVAGTSEYGREHDTAAQEFLCHAATLETVDQTGKLDYGITWLAFLVINPIPRVLWPEKAYPKGFGINDQDIREQTSLSIDYGSALGIVADLYTRFHLFSAIFFWALGAGLRTLFIAARNLSSPLATVGYVMVYALSLNMFAQGFGSIFVPLAYSLAPVAVFAWATRRSQRRARRRQKELLLLQVATPQRAQWSS
jgi:energy-coupling factor transporter transmembrane protein EcfT